MNQGTGSPVHVVVGLDLGTTYSGISLAIFDDEQTLERTSVTEWPSISETLAHTIKRSDKVKSVLSTIPGDQTQTVVWGFATDQASDIIPQTTERISQSPPREARWEYFKFHMVPKELLPIEVQDSVLYNSSRLSLLDQGVDIAYIVANFLDGVVGHACQFIENQMSAMSQTPGHSPTCHLMVAMPSCWPSSYEETMREALKRASIFPGALTTFVSEADASAMTVIDYLHSHSQGKHDLGLNDAFIIVDAGGATVDIVTYRISETYPFAYEQVTSPTSILAGSEVFNAAFASELRRRLERVAGLDRFVLSASDVRQVSQELWKQLTKAGSSIPDVTIPFPERFESSTSSSEHVAPCFHFSAAEIEEMLATSSINHIVAAIAEQSNMARQFTHLSTVVRSIFLVGGYGQYDYLGSKLNNSFSFSIERLRLDLGWPATPHGARLHGENDYLMKNGIQRDYCIRHPTSKASYGFMLGKFGNDRLFSEGAWLLQKNKVYKTFSIPQHRELILHLREGQNIFEVDIVKSSSSNPTNASTQRLAYLAIPVKTYPQECLDRSVGADGKTILLYQVKVVMHLVLSDRLSVEVFHRDIRLVQVQYPNDGTIPSFVR